MAGSTELKAQGLGPPETNNRDPNFQLLWKLLFTTRWVYRFLSFGVFIVLGAWGSYVTQIRIAETSDPSMAWLAWGLTLAGIVFEIYSGWWNVYLRGLNKVLLCSRILALAFTVKILISCGLLLCGAGLLSVPLATLVSSFLQRNISRYYALQFLSTHPFPSPPRSEIIALLRVLWPNSWRIGVHFLSYYLVPLANTTLCVSQLGLAANAQYGLTLQIATIMQGIAAVWIQVKWPIIGQYFARGAFDRIRQILRQRLLLQFLTFGVMAGATIFLGPHALQWLGTGKSLLPEPWLALMILATLLDLHSNTWVTFISVSNRLPFLWYTVGTNLATVAISIILLHATSLGFGALVLAPLFTNTLCNYWRWPMEGARMLQTRWWNLMFSRHH
jgi:Na+-driven multidrug efflux pump